MKTATAAKPDAGLSTPRRIEPNDVYSVATATQILGVRANTLPREIRKRRLRASKRAGRYFILGEWIIEWIRAGELAKGKSTARTTADADQAEKVS